MNRSRSGLVRHVQCLHIKLIISESKWHCASIMIQYIFVAITWWALFGEAFSPLGSVYCFNKVIKYHGVKPGPDTGRANFENLYSLPFRSVGFNVGSVTVSWIRAVLRRRANVRTNATTHDRQRLNLKKFNRFLLRMIFNVVVFP